MTPTEIVNSGYISIPVEKVCRAETSKIAQKGIINRFGSYPIFGASGYLKGIDTYSQDQDYLGIVKDGSGIGRVEKYPAYSSVLGTMLYILPSDEIDIDYLRLSLEYANLKKYHTGSSIPHIYFRDFKKENIRFYNLKAQKEIAKQILIIENIIENEKKQKELLDNVVKSRFIEMFGDPISNPFRWPESTIGNECFYVKDGPHKSLPDVGKGTNSFPFVSVSNIINGKIDVNNCKYISKNDYEESIRKCKPEKGDILYTKGGTTGIAKYIDIDIPFANWVHLAVLKFNPSRLNGVFFENMLNSDYCYSQSQRLTKGIANRDLVLSSMRQIKFFVPPMYLQEQFVDFKVSVDKSKFEMDFWLFQLYWISTCG